MYNVNVLHVLMIFVFYNFCDVPDEKASGRAFCVAVGATLWAQCATQWCNIL